MGGDEDMMKTEQEGLPHLGGGPGETINLQEGSSGFVARRLTERARQSRGDRRRRKRILRRLKKTPLFSLDGRIKDKLEEYNRLNMSNMLYFVETCHRSCNPNDSEYTLLGKLKLYYLRKINKSPAAKEHLWKTLMKNLPPPTLEDSLTSCKLYLLKDFRGRTLPKGGPHPFTTNVSRMLGDEVESVLGNLPIPIQERMIKKNLPFSGESVLNHRCLEEFKKYIIEVAAFLKKSPNKFGLEETVAE